MKIGYRQVDVIYNEILKSVETEMGKRLKEADIFV